MNLQLQSELSVFQRRPSVTLDFFRRLRLRPRPLTSLRFQPIAPPVRSGGYNFLTPLALHLQLAPSMNLQLRSGATPAARFPA